MKWLKSISNIFIKIFKINLTFEETSFEVAKFG